ncbi:MAG: hypothetical protein ACRDUY_14260 [Nitriliruptorales bacterium]
MPKAVWKGVVLAESDDIGERPVPWWGLAGGLFALAAVALEVVGSAWANSPAPEAVAALVPLAWPPPARVAWWLAVAGATGLFHLGMARAGHRRRPVVAGLTVALFTAFAVGIALGAEWATWH